MSVESTPDAPSPGIPTEEEVRRILVDRIDSRGQSVGIAVGLVAGSLRRVVAWGRVARGDADPVSGDTIFELSSVTKVFTATLLADMAERGEVALAMPVSACLPATVKVPRRGDREITLIDLATHTSGLPRLPTNMPMTNPRDPYDGYGVGELYEFLATYELPRDIGADYEYSNLGYGLLAHALALRAGIDYEDLLRARICAPLGLGSTAVRLADDQRRRLAVGHNDRLEAVEGWDYGVMAGAAALKSTVHDQLRFLAAQLGHFPSPLASALPTLLSMRRRAAAANVETALGWHVVTHGGQEIVMQGGITGGYSSFLGYLPATGLGVVVLSNAMSLAGPRPGVDDIGMHLLVREFPLNPPPKPRTPIAVPGEALEAYVGDYELDNGSQVHVTREDDRLRMQVRGRLRVELVPEGADRFFTSVGGAEVDFGRGDAGAVIGLRLREDGIERNAKRMNCAQ
jgi:CubicO group peptidase (beta-lactamase class C family)